MLLLKGCLLIGLLPLLGLFSHRPRLLRWWARAGGRLGMCRGQRRLWGTNTGQLLWSKPRLEATWYGMCDKKMAHYKDFLLALFCVFWCAWNAGKEEFQSFERSSEASRSGEEPECTTTDDECHETDAASGSGSDTDPVATDTDARDPKPSI